MIYAVSEFYRAFAKRMKLYIRKREKTQTM